MMKTYVILLAGGRGTRMRRGINKVLIPLDGISVLRRSAEGFAGLVDGMIVVYHPSDQSAILHEIENAAIDFPVCYTPGGDSRQESVYHGLRALRFEPDDIILIHDAARCLISRELISAVIRSVRKDDSGIPGLPVSSTYKICNQNGFITSTPDRSLLYEAQTPQGFRAAVILSAFAQSEKDGFEGTDDASVVEHAGYPVKMISGERRNIKLTTAEDLDTALVLLGKEDKMIRTGMGYDVHRFSDGRKLILCGVDIPHDRGLLGHSDADVAVHALMDALLGACALGDIGKHFPDQDPGLEGISSLILLKRTEEMIRNQGYLPVNIDITIVAQKPKLAQYIDSMTEKIAETMNMDIDRINVKATTTEKLGFEGREEGISAYAVCTVIRQRRDP